MTTEEILAVVARYRTLFEEKHIPKQCMDSSKTIGALTSDERLAHAHYLLDGVVAYAQMPGKEGKTGRHLASVQMILSMENWFTLDELKTHNRSTET